MATIALQRAIVARTISGNSPMVLMFPEAASQSFKRGEFVYLAAGKVTEIADNPAVILGMAAQDASTVTDTPIAVYVANEDTIFELNKVSNNSTASAGGTAVATAVTDVGQNFNLHRNTTLGITHAGLFAFGGNERLLCLDLGQDVVGDTGGRLLCMVFGRNRQLFSTS